MITHEKLGRVEWGSTDRRDRVWICPLSASLLQPSFGGGPTAARLSGTDGTRWQISRRRAPFSRPLATSLANLDLTEKPNKDMLNDWTKRSTNMILIWIKISFYLRWMLARPWLAAAPGPAPPPRRPISWPLKIPVELVDMLAVITLDSGWILIMNDVAGIRHQSDFLSRFRIYGARCCLDFQQALHT